MRRVESNLHVSGFFPFLPLLTSLKNRWACVVMYLTNFIFPWDWTWWLFPCLTFAAWFSSMKHHFRFWNGKCFLYIYVRYNVLLGHYMSYLSFWSKQRWPKDAGELVIRTSGLAIQTLRLAMHSVMKPYIVSTYEKCHIFGCHTLITIMHLSILCPTTPLPGDSGEKVGHLT